MGDNDEDEDDDVHLRTGGFESHDINFSQLLFAFRFNPSIFTFFSQIFHLESGIFLERKRGEKRKTNNANQREIIRDLDSGLLSGKESNEAMKQ